VGRVPGALGLPLLLLLLLLLLLPQLVGVGQGWQT
jgi:hypothetical protein